MTVDFQVAWEVMKWPFVACLVFPPLLVYLGLHVVKREVIFVDLALAQSLHWDLRGIVMGITSTSCDIRISLGVTFVGAAFQLVAKPEKAEFPGSTSSQLRGSAAA